MKRTPVAVLVVAVVVWVVGLAGCGVLSGSDERTGSPDDSATDERRSEAAASPSIMAATTMAVSDTSGGRAGVANGEVPPLWVVTRSSDQLSQRLGYNHPQLGTVTIAITYDEVPEPSGWLQVAVTATVDGSGETVFEWRGSDETFDQFEFAGAPQFENYRTGSTVPSPVDGLGHVFFDWGNARLPGISYLVPVATGFDDQGTFTEPERTGIYGATVADIDDDGEYEIIQIADGCAPTCQTSGDTIPLKWDGTRYSVIEAPAPASTLVPNTPPPAVPEATPPPVAAPPSDSSPSKAPEYGFYTAPQLGVEPVRGTGCGGDGTLGDIIPDGWWYGISSPWGPSSFEFDIVCVYYGESARPHVTECTSSPDPNLCLTYFSEDFWIVNNNDRTRTVALAPSIGVFNPGSDYCLDWDVRRSGNLSLIHIVGGQAVSLETRCPAG